MRKLWAVVLLASVLGAGGCSGARYLVYLLDPGAGKTTVPAEHDLARQTVAIVIYAGPETQLEYQTPTGTPIPPPGFAGCSDATPCC